MREYKKDMSGLVYPSESITLASGINQTAFLKGYDKATNLWDKSKCGMRHPNEIGTVIISSDMYSQALSGYEIVYDGIKKREDAIAEAARYAYYRSTDFGGFPLVLLMQHPSLRVHGIEYEIEQTGPWCTIKPPLVKIDRVLKTVTFDYDASLNRIKKLRFEDITDSL